MKFLSHTHRMIARLEKWMEINQAEQDSEVQETCPSADVSSLCEAKYSACETVLVDDSSSARDKYPHVSENSEQNASTALSKSSQYPSTQAPLEGTEALVLDKFSKLLVTGEESTSNKESINSSGKDTENKCGSVSPQPGNGETSLILDPNLFRDSISGAVGGGPESEHPHGSDKACLSNCLPNEITNDKPKNPAQFSKPDFPLLPMSRGFRLTLQKVLNSYGQALKQLKDFQSTYNVCENS